MNLRFVEAFYWVVTLRSVTHASEKLHLTQSAMSSRIAALEQELGTLRLDRRDRQFRVTLAGQRVFGHAERLLALQREIRAELGASVAEPVLLRVGAFESALHSWRMDWVRKLHEAQPGMALELTVETSPVPIDQLARGMRWRSWWKTVWASRRYLRPSSSAWASACRCAHWPAPRRCRRCRFT